MTSNALFAGRPETCLNATLHHLVIGSPDPPALADFYRRATGLDPITMEGKPGGLSQGRRLLFEQGEARTLHRAVFELPDAGELARLRQRIRAGGYAFEDRPVPFMDDAVCVKDPDGTELAFGVSATAGDAGQQGNSPPARLQHVVMSSPDPAPICGFFEEVLGFTRSDNVRDTAGNLTTTFLRCSAEHHSFAVFKASRLSFDHHCYEVTDWNAIRDWADHFADQKIQLKWGPGRHGPGNNLFIFVHDPDGNWVEFSAELEIVSHDRPVLDWPHEERTLNSWGVGLLRS